MTTITIHHARQIALFKNGKEQWFDLFRQIAACSLFFKDEEGMHVTYSLHNDGSLKRLFISDAQGRKMDRSNDMTYNKGIYYLLDPVVKN